MNPATASPTKLDNPPTYIENNLNVAAYLCCYDLVCMYNGVFVFNDPEGVAPILAGDYRSGNGSFEPSRLFAEKNKLIQRKKEWEHNVPSAEDRQQQEDQGHSGASKDTEKSYCCFTHRHLKFDEFGLWNYAFAVAKSGIFYFDGPEIAKQFSDQGKNIPYRLARNLVDKGFFELLKLPSYDPKTGRRTSAWYRPLSHEEWVAEHPSQCPRQPFPITGMANQSDVTVPALAVPDNGK